MGDDRWGEETVLLDRGAETPPEPPSPRLPRSGPRPPKPLVAVAAAGLISGGVVIAILTGGSPGSEAGETPTRPPANPAPAFARPEPEADRMRSTARDLALKRGPKGKLEERDREPEASGPDHEPAESAAPEPTPPWSAGPSPATVEPPPAPAPVPGPAASPPPAPAPEPTPPAVEFGL